MGTEFGADAHSVASACEEKWGFFCCSTKFTMLVIRDCGVLTKETNL